MNISDQDPQVPSNHIRIGSTGDENWRNDHLQFARLIWELSDAGRLKVDDELCQAMGLPPRQVREIIARARASFHEAVHDIFESQLQN